MSTERWVARRGNQVFLHIENDGWTFLRHGAEAKELEVRREPDGKFSYLAEGVWRPLSDYGKSRPEVNSIHEEAVAAFASIDQSPDSLVG